MTVLDEGDKNKREIHRFEKQVTHKMLELQCYLTSHLTAFASDPHNDIAEGLGMLGGGNRTTMPALPAAACHPALPRTNPLRRPCGIRTCPSRHMLVFSYFALDTSLYPGKSLLHCSSASSLNLKTALAVDFKSHCTQSLSAPSHR